MVWVSSHRKISYVFNCTYPVIGFPFPSLFQNSPGKHCRRRKARTVFSDQQLTGLEKRFEAQRYLSTPERVELASQLGLSETQVRHVHNDRPTAMNAHSIVYCLELYN